ncbi:MAG: NUDIX hydrolase [Bacteroidota bacterium]
MNFCSNCGHPIQLKAVPGDHLPRYACDACGTIHYQNPKIVTGCLPIWEDKVLLCRRAIEPRRGYWNVPAGYMENGETVEEGALRELWEEACAKAEIIGLHSLYDIPQINQVYMHYLGTLTSLDYEAGVESLEVDMFLEKDIPWEDIAFTSSIFTLETYFEDRRQNKRRLHTSVHRK